MLQCARVSGPTPGLNWVVITSAWPICHFGPAGVTSARGVVCRPILPAEIRNCLSRFRLVQDDFFGAGEPHKDGETINNFVIDIPQTALTDMKDRIRQGLSMLPSNLEGMDNFELGFNPIYLRNLSDSVLAFDWKQHERFLNSFAQKT